ncbi:MAG: protein kinase [Phototrophicaceae bacterium]
MSDFNKVVRGYRLNVEIGAGGFGTVYHAFQEVLKREVAVKVIKEKYVNNPQFVRQFEAEARIIARLEHFNIVTLYDYWRDPNGAYLIMRWLRGGSLRGYLKKNELDIAQMVRVINQTAAALSFAHQHNVIHRDIKPENILLDLEGNAFLTDFGIAVDLRNQDSVNMENISFGSPDYVAPEQLKDKIITPRSDIYSLGIMLYELLAGERPFVSKDPKEIMKMQLYNPVPSLRLKRPDLPPEIDTVIWQSTAKNPSHRYDNVLELAVAFQNIARKMDSVPESYIINTQRYNRARMPQVVVNTVGSMKTESMGYEGAQTAQLDSETTKFEMADGQETGILLDGVLHTPNFADEMAQSDALETGILPDTRNEDNRDKDTIILPDETATEDIIDTPVQVVDTDAEGESYDTAILFDGNSLMTPIPAPSVINDEQLNEMLQQAISLDNSRNLATLAIEGEGPPNPYKGLRAFEEADAGSFFGREEVVAQLVQDFSDNQDRFLALIGPSGSGKSSVVRAGMIPAFRRGAVTGSQAWFYSTMMPRDNPFRELREAILRISMIAPENWGNILEKDFKGLHTLLNMILPDDDSELLLFIDQFEEVFTLEEDETRRELFLNSLWFAVNQANSRLRLIVTLRADFYDRPLHYPQFGQLLKQHTEIMLPLSLQELESTIIEPANRVGLLVEPALKTAILNDVHNQPGALPLLQYALTELYDRKAPEQQMLTLDQYTEIGGIEGALAKRAEEIFLNLNADQQALARQLFLRIIAIDDNGTVTRRRVLWSEMMQGIENPETLQTVIDAFSKYRLLTTDRDQATRSPTIEVAHEALIKGWQQLSHWIEQNRAALQKRQELRIEADRWLSSDNQDKSYLVSGLRLIEFEALLDNDLLSLRPEERDYIAQSIAARQATINRQRQINIALRVFSAVTLVLFIAALVSFFFANEARADAEAQAQVAQSRELAASSLANQSQNDLALLLAVEAMAIEDTYESRNSLLVSLQSDALVQRYFHEHPNGLRAVDWDSTGTIAVAGGLSGNDNTILRWDMTTNTLIGEPLIGHTSWINDVQISPNNEIIASASTDSTVRLWNMETGALIATLEGHTAPVRTLDFALDGQSLASAGEDGTIIIWDVEARVIERRIDNTLNDRVLTTYDLDFNNAGTRLITGTDDNAVRIWDVATGEVILEMLGHNNWVWSVQYDPTEAAIISADDDGVLFFWNAQDGTALVDPIATNSSIYDVSLSFDGGFMATAGADGVIIIWSLAEQLSIVATIDAHRDIIWDVEFSPNDYHLLSASNDGNMLLSQLTAIPRPGTLAFDTNQTITEFELDTANNRVVLAGVPFGMSSSTIQVLDRESIELLYEFNIASISEGTDTSAFIVTDLALSADGSMGAVALTTGEVALWDMVSGELRWIDSQHAAIPKELEFIPDGSQVISADETGQIVVWDSATGQTIETTLYAPDSGVTAMRVSPNGQYLAIGGRGAIILWDLPAETLITDAMTTHTDAVIALRFDDDSTLLFSASRDRSLIQWDATTGAFIQRFEGHSDWVLSLDVDTAQNILVSGDRTGALRLWELSTGRPIGNALQGPAGWLTNLHFIDASTVLGSNQDNGVVLSWTVNSDDWIDLACSISNRALTRNEQLQFIRSDTYTPRCTTP